MTYDGPNPVLLRQQMRFQLWAMDLYHRPGTMMVAPDYFSRCGANLCFDELARNYLNRTVNFCQLYPAASGTMLPENMPGYRAPRIRTPIPPDTAADVEVYAAVAYVDLSFAPILTSIYMEYSGGHHFCLQTVPILTGYLTDDEAERMSHRPFYQDHIPVLASELIS